MFHFDLRGHGDIGAADGKEEAFKVFTLESDTARVVWVGRLSRLPPTPKPFSCPNIAPSAAALEKHQGATLAGLRMFYG